MSNLMDKSALERLQLSLVQQRIELQYNIDKYAANTYDTMETKAKLLIQAHNDLKVIEYFIDQIDAELEYLQRQDGTYVNPFISNYSANTGIDACNKDSIRQALETPHSDTDKTEDINIVDTVDFETGQG